MFRQIFWAVAAFNLVEPAITSSFVSSIILIFPNFSIFPRGLLLIAIVKAFFIFTSSITLQVKGVLPLAASPITTSCAFNDSFITAFLAATISSAASSTAFNIACLHPAIMKLKRFLGQLKVGNNSAPSCIPIRPEVPAPT
jgi:hypothetical protein